MNKTAFILAIIAIALCIVAMGTSDGYADEGEQGADEGEQGAVEEDDAVEWCKDQCVSYHDTERVMARSRYLECQRTAVHLDFCDIQYAEELATISSSEDLCKQGCEETPDE